MPQWSEGLLLGAGRNGGGTRLCICSVQFLAFRLLEVKGDVEELTGKLGASLVRGGGGGRGARGAGSATQAAAWCGSAGEARNVCSLAFPGACRRVTAAARRVS